MTIWKLTVAGTPAPKGSLKCVGRVREGAGFHQLVEDDKTGRGRAWRRVLTQGAARLTTSLPGPLDGPLGVAAVHIVPRPTSVTRPQPITRSSGDVDKLARMTLDALGDAGVYVDDSRICALFTGKTYESPIHRAGLWSLIWTPFETVRALSLVNDEFPDLV